MHVQLAVHNARTNAPLAFVDWTEHLVRVHLGVSHTLLLAAVLAVAGAWQLTRAKRRALFACGRTVPLPPLAVQYAAVPHAASPSC